MPSHGIPLPTLCEMLVLEPVKKLSSTDLVAEEHEAVERMRANKASDEDAFSAGFGKKLGGGDG